MAKKIENPLITGLSSKIYFLAYVNPETGYKIAKKIYGTPKTEKIYKWGKTLRKSGYLEKTKLFTANVKPLVIQIKYQLQQQGIRPARELSPDDAWREDRHAHPRQDERYARAEQARLLPGHDGAAGDDYHPAERPATNQRRLPVVLSVRFALTCARFLEFNWVPFSGELVYGHLGKEVSK